MDLTTLFWNIALDTYLTESAVQFYSDTQATCKLILIISGGCLDVTCSRCDRRMPEGILLDIFWIHHSVKEATNQCLFLLLIWKLCQMYSLRKIETRGDCYIVMAGSRYVDKDFQW